MATKAQALKAIQKAGVTLDKEMVSCDNYTLDAPCGYVFLANNESSYLAGNYDRAEIQFGGPTMGQIYDDIVMACNMGLVRSEAVA
jgi:hypothetical protein